MADNIYAALIFSLSWKGMKFVAARKKIFKKIEETVC